MAKHTKTLAITENGAKNAFKTLVKMSLLKAMIWEMEAERQKIEGIVMSH